MNWQLFRGNATAFFRNFGQQKNKQSISDFLRDVSLSVLVISALIGRQVIHSSEGSSPETLLNRSGILLPPRRETSNSNSTNLDLKNFATSIRSSSPGGPIDQSKGKAQGKAKKYQGTIGTPNKTRVGRAGKK